MNSMDIEGPGEEVTEYVPMQKYTRTQGEIQRKNEDNLRRFQDIEKRQQMYCIFIIVFVVIGMVVGISGIALGVWGRSSFKGLKNHVESTVHYCAFKSTFVAEQEGNATETSEDITVYDRLQIKINKVDENVGLDQKSGEFKAPIAGVYEITAHFHKNDGVNDQTEPPAAPAVGIKINEEVKIEGKMQNPGQNADTTSVSLLVEMAKLDKASLVYKFTKRAPKRGVKNITFCVSRRV